MSKLVRIATPVCFHCGERGVVTIEATDEELDNYDKGMLIQQAFPNVSKDLREQIITGTHPECWDEMFQ